MRTVLRHSASFSLSALLIFSTLSFTVDLHYCGKHLVDLAINEEADGCGMAMGMGEESGPADEHSMPCCKDVLLSFDGQEDLQKASVDAEMSQDLVFLASGIPYNHSKIEYHKGRIATPQYSPPPIIRDITLIHQSFLI